MAAIKGNDGMIDLTQSDDDTMTDQDEIPTQPIEDAQPGLDLKDSKESKKDAMASDESEEEGEEFAQGSFR